MPFESESPGGSDPDEVLQTYAGVPPAAVSVWEYGLVARPLASEALVMPRPVAIVIGTET